VDVGRPSPRERDVRTSTPWRRGDVRAVPSRIPGDDGEDDRSRRYRGRAGQGRRGGGVIAAGTPSSTPSRVRPLRDGPRSTGSDSHQGRLRTVATGVPVQRSARASSRPRPDGVAPSAVARGCRGEHAAAQPCRRSGRAARAERRAPPTSRDSVSWATPVRWSGHRAPAWRSTRRGFRFFGNPRARRGPGSSAAG